MKKIKEYKMSLMEKDELISKEKGKSNFIIRCSGLLEIEKLIDYHKSIENEYEEFVLNSAPKIYEALKEKKNKDVDTVGLWVTFDNGDIIENSIDISVLNDIGKYGTDDVEPLIEFFKMTLDNYESKDDKED